MDTMSAFAKGEANRGKELMVFDWDKAAQLISERKPSVASAGLADQESDDEHLVEQNLKRNHRFGIVC